MSWNQGIQMRDTLPKAFIDFAERKASENDIAGELQYITWFNSDLIHCDFSDEDGHSGSISLRLKGHRS